MKKMLFILSLLISKENNSQIFRNESEFRYNYKRFEVRIKKGNIYSEAYKNNIRAYILRDFMRKFKYASDVRWYVDKSEITAFFTYENENITVLYKRDGSNILTRKNYNGSRLNPGVAAFLKQEIEASFVIDNVTELIMSNYTVFEVSFQSEKQLCIVQVYKNHEDESMEVIDKKLLTKG